MKEKFIGELRTYLEKYEVSNKDEIIDKYLDRFELGEEAGFTEEEIIAKCGNPEDIALKYQNNEDDIEDDIVEIVYDETETGKSIILGKEASIKIETVSQDIRFIENDTDYTEVYIPEKLQKDFVTSYESTRISVKPKKKGWFNEKKGGQIVVKFGKNATLSFLDIDTVSGEVYFDVCNYIAKCSIKSVSGDITIKNADLKIMELVEVSGDIECLNTSGIELKTSSVSGDVTFTDCNFKIIKGSSVSGDIDYVGNLDIIVENLNTVNGDMTINGVVHPSTVNKAMNTIRNVFKKKNEENSK